MIRRWLIFVVSLVMLTATLGYSKGVGMIVIEERLDVYGYPSHSSNVMTTLEATWFVIHRTKSMDENLGTNRLGDWLYVDTGTAKDQAKGGATIRGWIKKYGVVELDDFERVTSFESFRVSGGVGDSYSDFTFSKDGTYIRYNEWGRMLKGNVYRKGRVFMARDSTPTDSKYYLYELFILDNDGYYVFPYGEPGNDPVRIKSTIYSPYASFERPPGTYHILTADNVNVREGPSIEARVSTRLRRGATHRVVCKDTQGRR